MADPVPLSDEQIRRILEDLNEGVTQIGLTVEVLRRILVSKKYMTELEMTEEISKLHAEAKATAARIHLASHRGPEGVH